MKANLPAGRRRSQALSFSCGAVLARIENEKKLTVMFYLEALGGVAFMTPILEKKG
jgi:hypothetical protein